MAMRPTLLAALLIGFVGAVSAASATSGGRPIQRGVSQGVTVDVYAPARAVFDLTHASVNARRHLRGPSVGPGCVKAHLVNGKWQATDGFVGPNHKFARRMEISFPMNVPTGSAAIKFRAPYDGCEIGGFYGHRWNDAWGTRDAVEIWLTVRGRHFFNDRAAARDLAYFVRSKRVHQVRLSATPRVGLRWFVRRYPGRVVELSKPTEGVPKDVIGFWVGPQTIVFTATSSTGRRLFVVAKRGTYKLPSKNLGDLAFVF
jgi:hypothetical protein